MDTGIGKDFLFPNSWLGCTLHIFGWHKLVISLVITAYSMYRGAVQDMFDTTRCR